LAFSVARRLADDTPMFLRYFVEFPLPARRIEDALLGSPATWLPA
jgi:hypothetical protein